MSDLDVLSKPNTKSDPRVITEANETPVNTKPLNTTASTASIHFDDDDEHRYLARAPGTEHSGSSISAFEYVLDSKLRLYQEEDVGVNTPRVPTEGDLAYGILLVVVLCIALAVVTILHLQKSAGW